MLLIGIFQLGRRGKKNWGREEGEKGKRLAVN